MKTSISVPEETYDRVERLMKKHGLSRSQFYAEAASRYADELEPSDLTAAVDAAGDDDSGRFAVAASSRHLRPGDDEW